MSNVLPAQLLAVQNTIHLLKQDMLSVSQSSSALRSQTDLLAALPPRYGEVLLNLLDRLESSALFTEESCSFSRKDLLDHLQGWVDQARTRLQTSQKL